MSLKYKYLLLIFIFFVLCSCSGMQAYYGKLESCMTKDDYLNAEALISGSQNSYNNKNELLYFLDLGYIQHITGKYEDSNTTFENAKQIYDENFTKSISAGAFSFFSNDNVITYFGQPYEMAYVNIFCALNYVMLGKDNEAVVEARQADNMFRKVKADSHGKAFYKDDGFIRYLMGIIYENAGYYNDAMISYKLAIRAYKNGSYFMPIPQDLIDSLYTAYYSLGMTNEQNELKRKFPSAELLKNKSQDCGQVIIINYNGLAPKKVDDIIEMSIYKAWPYFNSVRISRSEMEKAEQVRSAVNAGISDTYIKIAFPKYVRYNNLIKSFSVEENLDDIEFQVESFPASDIASLFENMLENQNAAIYTKTIARAVARYVMNRVIVNQVKQKQGDNSMFSLLANSVLNVTASLLESADKRSWRTLPENINMTRLFLQEGTHNLVVNFLDDSGNTVESQEITVEVANNKKTFVILNSFKYTK